MKEESFAWLFTAWLISLLGLLLSLYFEGIEGIAPCPLCWYQRLALFPLALILGIASYRFDPGVVFYALPLALFGFAVALYQTLGHLFPAHFHLAGCTPNADCTKSPYLFFPILSLPLLSAVGFFLIALLLAIAGRAEKRG